MRRLLELLMVAVAITAFTGCGQVKPGMRVSQTEERMPQASRDGLGPGGSQVDIIERGDKQAKVRIEAYYPLNQRHKPEADLLLSFADKYPGKVYVRLADFRTDRGKKLWYASGLSCGGIQINGKSEFRLKGRKEPTAFLQAIDVYWTKAELEAAVQETLAAVEGKAAATGKQPPAGRANSPRR